nr:transposase family protein [Streptomyces litmocidini]
MCRRSAIVCLIKPPSPATRDLSVPTDRSTALPDPRDRRGRRHSLVAVLLTAACAVLVGARFCPAIGQGARHAPGTPPTCSGCPDQRQPVATTTMNQPCLPGGDGRPLALRRSLTLQIYGPSMFGVARAAQTDYRRLVP